MRRPLAATAATSNVPHWLETGYWSSGEQGQYAGATIAIDVKSFSGFLRTYTTGNSTDTPEGLRFGKQVTSAAVANRQR